MRLKPDPVNLETDFERAELQAAGKTELLETVTYKNIKGESQQLFEHVKTFKEADQLVRRLKTLLVAAAL
ncbi:hypothetical protein BY996DRAFT_6553233 [Phakopsora pachyrhizi]|uniref:Uncharacterized protein n=1 Tax=Phakopsora pachyrhizi TaxID=170000 RepID=A0AAV0B189_PHAPC|nr:hypothetical protein BY996DRAFT_6553233 [Phakopsora pachyrhizi]CAH7676922.1 hypothetical protein PPACK8108_LOCUS12033 [Phakopsora pachyrhizi]